jgi:hypothetical protein
MCPWTIEKLPWTKNYSIIGGYYPQCSKTLLAKSHQNCDEKACIAYRISDESAYPTQYVNGCNGYYDALHSEIDKIAQVYMSGGIPLILLRKVKSLILRANTISALYKMIPQIHLPLHTQHSLIFGLMGSEERLS